MVLEIIESPLDSKEIKLVNPKENQPRIFIGKTNAEAEAPIFWPPDAKSQLIQKDPDAGRIEGKRRRGWQRMRWLNSITISMDIKQTPANDGGQRSLVCYSPWGHREC